MPIIERFRKSLGKLFLPKQFSSREEAIIRRATDFLKKDSPEKILILPEPENQLDLSSEEPTQEKDGSSSF